MRRGCASGASPSGGFAQREEADGVPEDVETRPPYYVIAGRRSRRSNLAAYRRIAERSLFDHEEAKDTKDAKGTTETRRYGDEVRLRLSGYVVDGPDSHLCFSLNLQEEAMCRECGDDESVEWTVQSFTEEVELILSCEYGPVWHRAPIEREAVEMAIQEGEDPFDFAVDFAAENDMVRRKDWGEEDNRKLLADMGMRWDGKRMVETDDEDEEDHCPVCEAMGLHWEGNRLVGDGWVYYNDDEEPNVVTEHRMKWRSGDGGQGA